LKILDDEINMISLCKNTNAIQRIYSSIIYTFLFIYVVLEQSNYPFLLFISTLLIGSLYEFIKIISKSYFHFIYIILILYIIAAFYILFQIKRHTNGEALILILLSQIWSSDVGGYIFGKTFGKNKLSNISPKKTWEGICGSFICALIIGKVLEAFIASTIQIHWMIISISLTTSSILGDLIVSKIKRIHNQEHSGCFLPGHGGFLDRLDSLFLATIVYYLIICI